MKSIVLSFFLMLIPVAAGAESINRGLSDEACSILQTVIDSPVLREYYHADKVPNRKPLRILVNTSILSCKRLRQFSEKVIIIEKPINNLPFLEVFSIEHTEHKSTVSFRYGAEGIEGTAVLHLEKKKWVLKNTSIIEN